MFKNINEEFKNASSMEKLNTFASMFSIMGVSLLTIINALGGITLIQFALTLVFGGIVLLALTLISLFVFTIIDHFSTVIPSVVVLVINVAISIILLGVFIYCIYIGIDFIKYFED